MKFSFRQQKETVFLILLAGIAFHSSFLPSGAAQEVLVREEEQLDFANGLFQREMYQMAQDEYSKYLEMFSSGAYVAEAQFGIAESEFFQEDYTPCVEAYTKLLTSYPEFEKTAVAYFRLGQAQYFLGNWDAALDALTKCASDQLSPVLSVTYDYYLGSTQLKKDNLSSAFRNLEKVVNSETPNPFTARAYLLLADIQRKNSQVDAALDFYQKARSASDDPGIQSLALLKIGETQFAQGDFQSAAQAFQQLTQEFSAQDVQRDAYINQLSSLFNLGDYNEVIQVFEEYQNNIPAEQQKFVPYYTAANAMVKKSEFDQAIHTMDEALKKLSLDEEEKTRALIKKAECLIKAERYQEALSLINDQLAASSVLQDEIQFLKGESYYGLKDYQNALAAYQGLSDEYPDSPLADEASWAQALTEKALGNDGRAMELMAQYYQHGADARNKQAALYQLVLLETKKDDKPGAITHAEKYLEEFPEGAYAQKTLFLLGNLYQKDGRFPESITAFEKYLQTYPQAERIPEVYFLLGYSFQSADKPDDALKAYQQVAADPSNTFYYSALKNSAAIYLAQDQPDQALGVFRRIITEFDQQDLGAETYFWMAERYLEQEKYNDVLAILNAIKAESLDPEGQAAAAFYKAEALHSTGVDQEAVKQYDLSLSLNPEGTYAPAARIGKALSLLALKDLDAAAREYELVIEQFPQAHTVAVRARYGLAEIEKQKGNLETAVKYYLLVAVLYQDEQYSPRALLRAGQLLEEQGKREEARKAYQEIIDDYTQSPDAQAARERLKGFRAQ